MPSAGCWAVHWPDNTDEPVWLFDSELGAKAFARSTSDDTTVTWEVIHDIQRARELSLCDPDRIVA